MEHDWETLTIGVLREYIEDLSGDVKIFIQTPIDERPAVEAEICKGVLYVRAYPKSIYK